MRFYLLFTMSAFTAIAAAQPYCDPRTQYEKDGKCCQMCEKGNRILPQSTCEAPLCEKCGKNEYMDTNTYSTKCKLQPYCDPNKHFQVVKHDQTIKTICLCKEGFHCSSKEDCILCMKHTECKPGFGVKTKGNGMEDTVCEPCPNGTFSNESSSDGACEKWTQCGSEYTEEKAGTAMSDTICVARLRSHIIVVSILPIIVVLVIGGIAFWYYRRKPRYQEMSAKACMGCQETEKITQVNRSPLAERRPLAEPIPEAEQSLQTERSTPVEDEDEESILDHGVTENGNVLTQEYGKMEILSRQESQTQEFCPV